MGTKYLYIIRKKKDNIFHVENKNCVVNIRRLYVKNLYVKNASRNIKYAPFLNNYIKYAIREKCNSSTSLTKTEKSTNPIYLVIKISHQPLLM